MMNDEQKPKEYDAVLGGNNPPPVDGLVLGGIDGVKNRLASDKIEVRIAAVKDALNYQDEGLDLVINALQDESRQVQLSAYKSLRNREEDQVKQALANYQPWNLRERFQEYPGYRGEYTEVFANRRVENFNIDTGIVSPVNIAYAIRDNQNS
ncbi:HEAT repeat domain-containing protein [Hyella patelloides]|nr:HEAT repeat domain-containing protein [Hyella patelloides]